MSRISKTLCLVLLLASATYVNSTTCTADSGCTSGNACDNSVSSGTCEPCTGAFNTVTYDANCATCNFWAGGAATASYKCNTGATGYFGTVSGHSTSVACNSVGYGGQYDCTTCGSSIVSPATTVVCSTISSSAVDSATGVGWYVTSTGGTNWCSNALLGCSTCVTTGKPTSTAGCLSVQAGYSGSTTTGAGSSSPVLCPDAFCLSCTAGQEATNCNVFYGDGTSTSNAITGLSGSTTYAYVKSGTNAVTTIYQYDDSGLSLTYASGAVTAITCVTGAALVTSTNLGCSACNDPDFGVTGATGCSYVNGVITVTACGNGYVKTTTAPITCVPCSGSNVATCALNSAGTAAAAALTCVYGYFFVSASATCVAFPTGANPLPGTAPTYASGTFTIATGGCLTGYYLASGTCTKCATGAYSCTGATAITACTNGYYLASGSTSCTAYTTTGATANCAYGTSTSNANPTACTVCNIGYTATTAGTCLKCVDTNANQCIQVGATTTFSTACAVGYSPDNGLCIALATGYQPWSPASIVPSGSATTAPAYAEASTSVNLGTLAPSATYWGAPFDTPAGSFVCASGYYVGAGSQCTACGTGIATCGLMQMKVWPYTCASGYTRTKGAVSSAGAFTYPACNKNSSGFYLAVSYIALAAMFVLALF